MAATLAARQSVTLNAGTPRFQSNFVPIDPLTDVVMLRLRRPTTAVPLAWTEAGICRVTLVVAVDGEEYRAVGQTRGGVRTGPEGEIGEYRLIYRVPYYDPGGPATVDVEGKPVRTARRIGERRTTVEARVILERIAGTITTEILAAVTTESAPPVIRVHNSVGFDTATSAQDQTGDGVIAMDHTSSGSNRAVFACTGAQDVGGSGASSTSMTYGASGMTEMWDFKSASLVGMNAGYRLALGAGLTGAQTVTSTISGDLVIRQALIVVSFTGVDQTTPVGTPVTTVGTTSPSSVTVTSVAADDMVVDSLFALTSTGATIGADQTARDHEDITNAYHLYASTQPGTAGGVMSWTFGAVDFHTLGAVAFKTAAGAAVSLPCDGSTYGVTGADAGVQQSSPLTWLRVGR